MARSADPAFIGASSLAGGSPLSGAAARARRAGRGRVACERRALPARAPRLVWRAAAAPQDPVGDPLGDTLGSRVGGEPKFETENPVSPLEFQDDADAMAGAPVQGGAGKKAEKPVVVAMDEVKTGVRDVGKDVGKPEEVKKPEAGKAPEAVKKTGAAGAGVGAVKMPEEDVEAAKERREKVKAMLQKSDEDAAERTRGLVKQASGVLSTLGEKTGVVALGTKARIELEERLDDALEDREIVNKPDWKPSQDDKERVVNERVQARVQGGAASVYRNVTGSVSEQWTGKVVPVVQEKLPSGFEAVSSSVLNSAFATAVCGLLLLPLFVGGGGSADKPKADSPDTAALERKLAKNREERVAKDAAKDITSPFPPEAADKTPAVVTAPAPIVAAPKVAQAPAKVVEPIGVGPNAVATSKALVAVKEAVGSSASLVQGASYDSLTAERTIIVEVDGAFRKLPLMEKRIFADSALRAVQLEGFEAVRLLKTGSDVELARAGVDIDIEDEAANLRAQLRSVEKKVESLAVLDVDLETQLDTLRQRMAEQREELDNEKVQIEALLRADRKENSILAEELLEARTELSKLPDIIELETRTEEAEAKTQKLTDTVDMLSRQVGIARSAEEAAVKSKANAIVEAQAVKEAALKYEQDAESRVQAAAAKFEKQAELRVQDIQNDAVAAIAVAKSEAADAQAAFARAQDDFTKKTVDIEAEFDRKMEAAAKKAEATLLMAQKDSDSQVVDLRKQVEAVEASKASSEAAAAKNLEDVRKSLERSQAEALKAKDAELKSSEQTIQAKYDKLLDEVQKKAKDDLNRFNSQSQADKKAFDTLQKTMDKEGAEFAKEKAKLTKKIDALDAKLKGKAEPVEAAPAPAAQTDEA